MFGIFLRDKWLKQPHSQISQITVKVFSASHSLEFRPHFNTKDGLLQMSIGSYIAGPGLSFLLLGVLLCHCIGNIPLSFRLIHSDSSGTNFPPTFPLFHCSSLFKSLSFSLTPFFSSFYLPWFYCRRSNPLPLLVWSGLLIYHSLSSQDILPFPVSPSLSPFPPHSLPLSSPRFLSVWGWSARGGEYLLTLFLFHTLTLFSCTQQTRSHTYMDDNVRCLHFNSTEELSFTWFRVCLNVSLVEQSN